MDNKFDLKKYLVENKKTTISESTDLVNRGHFKFTRFNAGPGKMGLQISNNSKIGEYIHVPGALLGQFAEDLEDAIKEFDNIRRQLPLDEEHGEMYTDEDSGRTLKSGDIIYINGISYRVLDNGDLMNLGKDPGLEGDEGNNFAVRVEQ